MSDVYADIATLIDDELTEVHSRLSALDNELDAAIRQAHTDYDAKVDPLNAKASNLYSLRTQVAALSEQAATPVPTPPTAPESSAGTSSDATPQEDPSSPVESSPTAPSDSPSTEPAAPVIPQDAIALADTPDAIAAGVDASTPVTVPTATGEVAVVTVDDVIVASDPTVADSALTEAQHVVRNSELP